MNRTTLEESEANGQWRYAITYNETLLEQTIYQAVDDDFYTQVHRVTIEDREGQPTKAFHAIMLVEGPFTTHDEAIACGDMTIRQWDENDRPDLS